MSWVTRNAKRQHQGSTESEITVQAKNPIAGALVILQPLWTILEFVFEKKGIDGRKCAEFRVSFLPQKVLIFQPNFWDTPLEIRLRNNHRHDASLPTTVNLSKEGDKVATSTPKAMASWKVV